MAEKARPLTPALRAFLDRVVGSEGGYKEADDATGLPNGTFWRWLHYDVLPSADNLRKVAERIGRRYGVSAVHLAIKAEYLPADATRMPEIAFPQVNTKSLRGIHLWTPEEIKAVDALLNRILDDHLPASGNSDRTGPQTP